MSQRRKQYLQNQKRNKKLLITIAIFFILIFGLGFIWLTYQKDLAKKSLEAFVADDLVSLVIININLDSKQNTDLKKVAMRMGDEKLFSNYLKNLILQGLEPDSLKIDETTFYGWLGEKIGVGNIRVTSERTSKIFILNVKNQELLKNFLSALNDNLEKKGYVLEKEDFRGKQITTIKKNQAISYAVMDDYVLVAEHLDGLKKMIDTKLGKYNAVVFNKNYKKAKTKLKDQDGVVFAYGDVMELLKVFLKSNLKLDENIYNKIQDIGAKYYAAAKFFASEDKIMARIYFPELNKISSSKKIKPLFANDISSRTAFYTEGASLKPLLLGLVASDSSDPNATFALISRGAKLEYGIDLDKMLKLLNNQYGIYLAPDFSNEKVRLALFIDWKNKKDLKDQLPDLDKALVKLGEKYLNNNQKIDFINRKYKDISYKIMLLPKKNFDLGYYYDDQKLVLFSNEKILENLSDNKKLAEETSFKDFYNSKNEQIIYLKIDDLIKLSVDFGQTKDENANSLAKTLDAIRITKNRKWSGNFIDAEIVVK